MTHTCHAVGCDRPLPPRLLMCGRHWRLVLPALKSDVFRHYRPGQEIDQQPTAQYIAAATAAIAAVAEEEGITR